MDTEFLVSVAVQIPLVAFFAWFVIKRDKDVQITIKERDDAWRTALKEQENDWKTFIETQNKSGLDALQAITEALKSLTRQIAKNTAITILHDATVRGTNPETIGTTQDIMGKLLSGTDRYKHT